MRRVFAVLLIVFSASAQEPSRLRGISLSGRSVTLPDAAGGKPLVIVAGFSKDCAVQSKEWTTRLRSDFGDSSRVLIYRVPFLEEVPRLFRGIAVAQIRNSASPNDLDSTVPVLDDEAAWKRLVGYGRPEDAYVILIGPDSKVRYVTHGKPEREYPAFEAKLRDLLLR